MNAFNPQTNTLTPAKNAHQSNLETTGSRYAGTPKQARSSDQTLVSFNADELDRVAGGRLVCANGSPAGYNCSRVGHWFLAFDAQNSAQKQEVAGFYGSACPVTHQDQASSTPPLCCSPPPMLPRSPRRWRVFNPSRPHKFDWRFKRWIRRAPGAPTPR